MPLNKTKITINTEEYEALLHIAYSAEQLVDYTENPVFGMARITAKRVKENFENWKKLKYKK